MISLALFLLGIGLLLSGVSLLSDALKRMGNRTFRRLAFHYMTPRWKALLLGLGSGMVLQSTSAAMFILAGLISVGSITTGQAISILTSFGVGNCLLPFLVSFKIRTAVFYVVGIASILLYFNKDKRLRNVFSLAFGLGLIFLGIEMMLDGVHPLRDEPWFSQALAFAGQWPGLTIVIGVALGLVVQSSTTVVVVAIGLAKGGILSGQEVFLIMYGAAIGSTGFKMFLGSALSGSGRQLVRFVNLFNFTGAGIFILLYYIEFYLNIPLVMALASKISHESAVQAAWVFLFLNATTALIYIAIHRPLTALLNRQFPPAEEEVLSKPKYLARSLPSDPYTALDLIRMEELRECQQVAAFLSTLSDKPGGLDLENRFAALKMLAREIEAALAEVLSFPLDAETAQWHATLQTRQTLIRQLADTTSELAMSIRRTRAIPEIQWLSTGCLEAIDFLFQHAVELIQSGEHDESERSILYSDRGPQMRQLREAYLNQHQDLTHDSLSSLLSLTLGVEKCVWLLNRILESEHERQLSTGSSSGLDS